MIRLLIVFLCVATLPREGEACLASYNPDIPPTTVIPPTTTTLPTTTTTGPPCLMGWSYFADTNSCYYLGANMGTSFTDSRAYCQGQGGDLVSIHSQAENDFVTALTPVGPPAERVQIGGRKIGPGYTDADFTNWDGTPFDYSNWSPGEPNGPSPTADCVFMITDDITMPVIMNRGQWNDADCTLVYPYFVCKAPAM